MRKRRYDGSDLTAEKTIFSLLVVARRSIIDCVYKFVVKIHY